MIHLINDVYPFCHLFSITSSSFYPCSPSFYHMLPLQRTGIHNYAFSHPEHPHVIISIKLWETHATKYISPGCSEDALSNAPEFSVSVFSDHLLADQPFSSSFLPSPSDSSFSFFLTYLFDILPTPNVLSHVDYELNVHFNQLGPM